MPGVAEIHTGSRDSGAPAHRVLITALALACLAAPPAQALDPRTALVEYSLANWAEHEGPFPFGV
jgi:hypothetical protein